ncbi:RING-14 protein [Tricladium varicosporioides]|nr:RING-14 protein [Hymenoscyphus varicosporioides]
MKFAHEFKAALIREGFPAHWVESAVPYGQLKKLIKKVTAELQGLGLDSKTLAQLVPGADRKQSTTPKDSDVAFRYDFDGDETTFHPKLTLFVQNGLAVDAKLTPETRAYLENLAWRQQGAKNEKVDELNENQILNNEYVYIFYPPSRGLLFALSEPKLRTRYESNPALRSEGDNEHTIQRIEVPLTFDSEFFHRLKNEVEVLDTLQEGEQKVLANEIVALSNDVRILTKPSKFSKTDMYRWRELFEIYLEAMVFFSTHELDHGKRDSATATKQLQWFQSEVMRRGIIDKFKLPASHKAVERFVKINVTLLRNVKFQEINQTAVTKILKKFDKRTKLGATRTFPKLIHSGSAMSQTMAKAVCAQLTQDLLKVVPQIDDYLCPICFSIAWRPVRMTCEHVFCISCAVTLQRKKQKFCPLCRGDVILKANADSIDSDLEKFMEKYFPKETREKRIAVETERGKEQFGESYKHPSEGKCSVM